MRGKKLKASQRQSGTQFTCFTSTKLKKNEETKLKASQRQSGTQSTCFTSTKVQILALLDAIHRDNNVAKAHFPYQYKSTNTHLLTSTKVQILTQKALLDAILQDNHPVKATRACSVAGSVSICTFVLVKLVKQV